MENRKKSRSNSEPSASSVSMFKKDSKDEFYYLGNSLQDVELKEFKKEEYDQNISIRNGIITTNFLLMATNIMLGIYVHPFSEKLSAPPFIIASLCLLNIIYNMTQSSTLIMNKPNGIHRM